MNKAQKTILTVAAAAVFLMMLFPPFHIFLGEHPREMSMGYSFLFSPPVSPISGRYEAGIDVHQLIAQWVGVALIAALLYFAVRSEK